MSEKKFDVEYSGGESRHHAGKACDYMLCIIDDGAELYAEVIYTDDEDECDPEVDFAHYCELREDIEAQARKIGIPAESLAWCECDAKSRFEA